MVLRISLYYIMETFKAAGGSGCLRQFKTQSLSCRRAQSVSVKGKSLRLSDLVKLFGAFILH